MPGVCDRIDPPFVTLSEGADVSCHLYGEADRDQEEA
jgi:hypothetical protein